ncbi:hypothetical protein [Sorangium atrum]|uniref:YHYH domain-containing protein n=1 Tax=Sorangium atrum TaxID=2995308 RepID=A0ABT5CK95_9BACT|nr:hypothetical protein [Sorangium aterium]MDC0685506.1 hypothetical protein [Sorangium aterium]
MMKTPFLVPLFAGAALLHVAGGCSVPDDLPGDPGDTRGSIDVDEPIAEAGSALSTPIDNVCTAVPSYALVDRTVATKKTRYSSTEYPNGMDLFSIGVTGPTCQISTAGFFNASCCPSNQGTTPYSNCKSAQDDSARAFLNDLRVRTPLVLPFYITQAERIKISTAYYKNNNADHAGAIDFYKSNLAPGESPSFQLVAPAASVVVFAGWWGATGGNLIMLRHTAPNGENYFTEYRHVRGGVAHDKKAACSCIDPAVATAADRLAGCTTEQQNEPICKYAANPTYDHLWGLTGYSLPAVGTVLARGEAFGYAGNTGTIRDNIDVNGIPDDPTGNTHLHFATWVERPDGNNDGVPDQDGAQGHDIVAVDPFGVYSKLGGTLNGKGCYDPANTSTFRRIMAPHYPETVNLPDTVAYANNHDKYYPDAGWYPQTFNIYNKDGARFVALGYSPDAPSQSTRWFNLSKTSMNNKIAELDPLGWKVRQISVRLESGAPRYTAIWEKKAPGETSEVHLDITDAQYTQLWNDEVVPGNLYVLDHSTHTSSSGRRHNVVLTSAVSYMVDYYDMTGTQLRDTDDDLQDLGWKPYSISAQEGTSGSGVRFSGVWRWLPGEYEVEFAQSESTFKAEQLTRSEDGWRLHRVQGYDNGTMFVSIWHKP